MSNISYFFLALLVVIHVLTLDQDDTVAINNAITDGNRCGENCYGSSVKGAVVYFPPGEHNYNCSCFCWSETR